MSEHCLKCGSSFDEADSYTGRYTFLCGTTSQLMLSMSKGPYTEIIESTQCLRNQLTAALEREAKLIAFKEYVHKRLDDFGVPSDPDPEHNKEHGCRIEGRLNYVFKLSERVKARVKELEEAIFEVAIPSLKHCEKKHGHDNQARLNLEALFYPETSDE